MGRRIITFEHHGDFKNTEAFLNKASKADIKRLAQNYGAAGVAALSAATPKDSGNTAGSWDFNIEIFRASFAIQFTNSNITTGGTPVAILIQYGHGTRSGGYVIGRDFINPAIQPIFDQLAEAAWREVGG